MAMDSIGTAHGTITGGMQSGGGVVLAGGTSNQYVSLPASAFSGLTNATFETWATWTASTSTWERLFDFGSNSGGAGAQGTGNTYIFFSPRPGAGTGTCTLAANNPRVAITMSSNMSESCAGAMTAFPSARTHVAITIGTMLTLYINGSSVGSVASAVSLSDVTFQNNWLGRSQWTDDPEFAGTIFEFRIYDTERTAAQIMASATAGPDMVPAQ
jgi:hypothetical protein